MIANEWTNRIVGLEVDLKLHAVMLSAQHDRNMELESENAAIKARLKHVEEVCEKFRHLDTLLSDESWLKEEGNQISPQRKCLFDVWKDIRKEMGN
jgi:hypothetical protein